MNPKLPHRSLLARFQLVALLAAVPAFLDHARADATDAPASGAAAATADFDATADRAIAAMKKRAEDLHVMGVAVVAYSPGDSVTSWSSKMIVVGHMSDEPTASKKGSNLLGIAYAKAAEMASTLKDSGSGVRPLMTGEYGWHGGVVGKGRNGTIIAAFSGGRDADDLSVSKTGLAVLAEAL
jgi:hypothetical protein